MEKTLRKIEWKKQFELQEHYLKSFRTRQNLFLFLYCVRYDIVLATEAQFKTISYANIVPLLQMTLLKMVHKDNMRINMGHGSL